MIHISDIQMTSVTNEQHLTISTPRERSSFAKDYDEN